MPTPQPRRLRRVDRVHGSTALGADGQVDKKSIVIPPGYWDLFDPFLMLSEDWFCKPGFEWHPHRGIETVTVILDGALEHGDNRGNAGVLGPGDIQWMTAGSGIIHRELAHRDEHVHTLQLWVNLPSSHKLVDARYQDFTPASMAVDAGPGTRVEIVAGGSGDLQGPADTHWPVTGRQVSIEPGRHVHVPLPGADRAFVYVLSGNVLVGRDREPLAAGEVAWSDPLGDDSGDDSASESSLELHAPEGDEVVRAIVFSGRPIGEPVAARGPFVMNTAAEIQQAFVDFHAGTFGDVPALARL